MTAGEAAGTTPRRRIARIPATAVVPLIVYFVIRPSLDSDAAALAISGAVPAVWTIALVLVRREVDLWAMLTSVGFAAACVASLLAGGNSLPLKLPEATVTFLVGVVLLVTALIGRPLPVGRALRVPDADRRLDLTLSTMIGCFLVLHALLTLTLALTMSTATYLTAGRAVNWATIAVGALGLYGYVHRARQRSEA